MKLSLWQQFSSNHSASFTIVGRFETGEAAQQATDELRSILSAIEAWYNQPENAAISRQRYEDSIPPSPVEMQFAEQYSVEWNQYSIDWAASPEDTVVVLDNHVFINSMHDTWLGPQPFDQIMEKLGGATTVSGEAGEGTQLVHIDCMAPNEAIANSLFDALQTYFANPIHLRCPWQSRVTMLINRRDGKTIKATPEEQIEAQDWYSKLTNAANEARGRLSQSPEMQRLINESWQELQRGDRERGQAMQQEVMEKMDNLPEVQSLQAEIGAHPDRYRIALQSVIAGHGLGALSGSVPREALKISITNLRLYRLNTALPSMLEYLRSEGCQDTNYRLTFQAYDMGEPPDWVDEGEQ